MVSPGLVIAEARLASPSLEPERRDDLGFRVQRDVEAALVIGRQRAPQPRNALADGIAVRPRVLHRLDQFGDDMRRRRAVGIAHAEVDDVLPGAPRLCLGRVHFGEDVGRQAADAMELAGGIGTHDRPFGVQERIIVADVQRRAATGSFSADADRVAGHAGRLQRIGDRPGRATSPRVSAADCAGGSLEAASP